MKYGTDLLSFLVPTKNVTMPLCLFRLPARSFSQSAPFIHKVRFICLVELILLFPATPMLIPNVSLKIILSYVSKIV